MSRTRITTPGIYADVSEAVYHADPCPTPSLSNSIAKILLDQSALHAADQHPRLRVPDPDDEPREITAAMDFGSALHKTMLGKGAEITLIEASDYRKDVAKGERDSARAAGRIPLLRPAYDRMTRAAEAGLRQMRERADCQDFFAPGISEAVIAWQDGDVWCRSMVDRLPDDPRAPAFDLKGTGLSAAPTEWDRRLVRAYRTQSPFYGRGLKAIRKIEPPPLRYVVVEDKRPFAVSVLTHAPSLYQTAAADVDRAIRIWGDCLRSGRWPGYPQHTAHVEAPNWLLNAADEQALRDEFEDAA